MQERDEEGFEALSKLRRHPADHPDLVAEALDIKASIIVENTITRDSHPGVSGFKLHVAQVSRSFLHIRWRAELTFFESTFLS